MCLVVLYLYSYHNLVSLHVFEYLLFINKHYTCSLTERIQKHHLLLQLFINEVLYTLPSNPALYHVSANTMKD